MNTTFWWFDVSSEGVGEPLLVRDLNQDILQKTIEEFIVNPENRNNLSKVPDYIEHVEKNTSNNQTGEEVWSEEKENYFQRTLQKVFRETLNKELKLLVDKYIPTNSKLHEMNLLSDGLELKDLLNSDKSREFTGYSFERGTDLSGKQKDLLQGKKLMDNDELFDDSVLSSIKVKFTKNNPNIIVIFEADHSVGEVQKKIFKEVFPQAKVFTEKDPVSIGGAIREGFPGYVSEKYQGKKTSLTSFSGNTGVWAGAKQDNIVKYFKLLRAPYHSLSGKNKARVDWMRRRGKELQDKNKYSKGSLILLIQQAIARDTEEQIDVTDKLDEKYSIKLNSPQAKMLKEGFNDWLKDKKNHAIFIKFFEELIDSGDLYKYLKKVGVDMDPWRLQTYSFKFILNVEKGPNSEGKMLLNSSIEIKPSTRISKQGLSSLSQQYKFKQPIIPSKGSERATVTFQEESEKGKGFNEARDYFLKQVKTNIEELKQAASYLEVNE